MDHLFDMVTIMRWFLSRSTVNTKYIIYQFQFQISPVSNFSIGLFCSNVADCCLPGGNCNHFCVYMGCAIPMYLYLFANPAVYLQYSPPGQSINMSLYHSPPSQTVNMFMEHATHYDVSNSLLISFHIWKIFQAVPSIVCMSTATLELSHHFCLQHYRQ